MFKIVYTDTVTESRTNSVESVFSVTYTKSCEDNLLSISEDFTDKTYILDSGVQSVGAMSVAETNSEYNCDLSHVLYVF